MRVFIKKLFLRVRGFALLATVFMIAGCGNKGDLFLDGSRLLVETTPPIEGALDELEVLEAEEAEQTGNTPEDGLPDDEALSNSKKLKE